LVRLIYPHHMITHKPQYLYMVFTLPNFHLRIFVWLQYKRDTITIIDTAKADYLI
jgi:hypothetical protein